MAELQAGSTMNGELLLTEGNVGSTSDIWTETLKLQSSDIQGGDYFGRSVSLSGDGLTLIVGADGEDTGASAAGAVYIYEFVGTWIEVQKLQASDLNGNDRFGECVSISDDGLVCAIGAYLVDVNGDNAGAFYIFEKQNGTWVEIQKLQPSDIQAHDYFSETVEISKDGLTCIAGSYFEDTGGTTAGSAYIFKNDNGTWVEVQKLQSNDIEADDWFGKAVTISGDGLLCAIGAPYEDTTVTSAGSVYIFENQNGTWVQTQKVQASDAEIGGVFGFTLSMSSDGLICLVGAYLKDSDGVDVGVVYVLENQNGTWVETQILTASNKDAGDYFGEYVAISSDGSACIIGANREDSGATNIGSAYLFENNNGTWTEVQRIQASDKEVNDFFGRSVAISGDGLTSAVGTTNEDTNGSSAGSAYIYERY